MTGWVYSNPSADHIRDMDPVPLTTTASANSLESGIREIEGEVIGPFNKQKGGTQTLRNHLLELRYRYD